MTRWARGGSANKKKPLDATGWKEMAIGQPTTSNGQDAAAHIKDQSMVSDSPSRFAIAQDSHVTQLKKTKKKKRNIDNNETTTIKTVAAAQPEANCHDIILPKKKRKKISAMTSTTDVLDVLMKSDDIEGLATDKSNHNKQQVGTPFETVHLLEYIKKDHRREARRTKRANERQNSRVCFNCRQPGHDFATCPKVVQDVEHGTGICFKCGSTEHGIAACKARVPAGQFPFAKCFICGEQGHLSRSCPDNPRGLYPNGGCCRICDSVEHFKKDCPELQKQQGIQDVKLPTISHSRSLDDDETFSAKKDVVTVGLQPVKKLTKTKVVKF